MSEHAVRIIKCQITPADKTDEAVAAFKAAKLRWRELGEEVRRFHNFVFRSWEQWHVAQKTDIAVAEFQEALVAWHKAEKDERGEKPKCTAQAWPKEFGNHVYHQVTKAFPHMHSRVIVLLLNTINGNIRSRKSADTAWPWWQRVLTCHERPPVATKLQPIPFDYANSKLEKGTDGLLLVMLRVWRLEKEKGKQVAKSEDHLIHLRPLMRHRGFREAVNKLLSGEWRFRGSELVCDSDGRWFVHLCYQTPKRESKLDPNRTAYLIAGRNRPLLLKLPGQRARPIGYSGDNVGRTRQRLLTSRWERQENYRTAGRATRGRGRRRALLPVEKLSNAWRDFCKSHNQQSAAEVVKRLESANCGSLVWITPRDGSAKRLETAGKIPGRRDSSSWPWFQLKSCLNNKGQEFGFQVVEKKHPAKKKEESETKSAKGKK